MKKINNKIFREYDIRGKYPEEVNAETFFVVGQAFARLLKKHSKKNTENALLKHPKTVAVSRDMRKESTELARAFVNGILSENLNVDYLGLTSSPLLFWTVSQHKYLGGAIITASHNVSGINGIKLCLPHVEPFDTQNLLQYTDETTVPKTRLRHLTGDYGVANPLNSISDYSMVIAKLQKKCYMTEYVEFVKSFFTSKQNVRVAIDAAWATASEEIPYIFNQTNVDFIPLCFGPTENFSDKDINPANKDALDDLIRTVKKFKTDIGIGFDGDADRIFFVDENGNIVDPEIISILIASTFLENNREKNKKIVLDSRAGWTSQEAITKLDGQIFISRSGHLNIKKEMLKQKAIFGAETSGHYFFNIGKKKQYIPSDNAMIAMIKILNIISASKLPFSKIIKKYKSYPKSGELNFKVSNPQKIIKKFIQHLPSCKSSSTFDGLSVEYDDWRINVRPSNTEDGVLRVNVEARTISTLKEKIKLVRTIVRS